MKLIPGYTACEEAGGILAVACYPGYYGEGGSVMSLPIVFGGVHSSKGLRDVRATQADGNEAWIYNCPATNMAASPAVYRHRYGLAMWRNKEDGAMPWEYSGSPQNLTGAAYDFDQKMSLYAFVYPTWSGKPIDTLIYEAYREGIYDTRFMATLEKYLEQARSQKQVPKSLILEIDDYLENLSLHNNLGLIRRQIADYTLRLHKAL